MDAINKSTDATYVNEESFRQWLNNNVETKGTANRYITKLKNLEELFGIKLEEPLMNISDPDQYNRVEAYIRDLPNFREVNSAAKNGNGDISAVLKHYRNFLGSLNGGKTNGGDVTDLQDKFDSNLQLVLAAYKKEFPILWKNEKDGGKEEKYKLAAVQQFQQNWDVNADDFAKMLDLALKKAGNLLSSRGNHAKKMILDFAKAEPDTVRDMFANLYDGLEDLDGIPEDLEQRINEFKVAAEGLLERHGKETWKRHYQEEHEISTYLWLRFPDKYYVYKYSVFKALTDALDVAESVHGSGANKVIASYRLYDKVREAALQDKELNNLYQRALENESEEQYYQDPERITLTVDIAHFVEAYYKPQQKPAAPRYWLYAPGQDAMYWDEFYNAGIMAIGWDEIGDLSQYQSKSEIKKRLQETIGQDGTYTQASKATWQFLQDIHPGDIVYVKKGKSEILGRGEVTSDYKYDDSREYFCNTHSICWTHKGVWDYPIEIIKTLTEITDTSMVEDMEAMFRKVQNKPYTEKEFCDDVYMSEERLATLLELLRNKQNVILQGAPGVGKTYAARKLAYVMMGEQDDSRIELVQFHQNYSYEDFIMGYKPTDTGFELKQGVFYDFCKKAAEDPNRKYFFIIDEINRGNLSKIFGELLMMIEKDYRGMPVRLAYNTDNDEMFRVPKNLYIIGMMNTADRSLALIDYALRRRFSFFKMKPGFKTEGFRKYLSSVDNADHIFEDMIGKIVELNKEIAGDKTLGEGFQIGHSYFCGREEICTQEWLTSVVRYDIIPMLEEYWFDNDDRRNEWTSKLDPDYGKDDEE